MFVRFGLADRGAPETQLGCVFGDPTGGRVEAGGQRGCENDDFVVAQALGLGARTVPTTALAPANGPWMEI